MGKKNRKFKKNLSTAVQTEVTEKKVSQEDSTKQFAISDLKKTAIIIAILFALEFLIFYANLMGTGA